MKKLLLVVVFAGCAGGRPPPATIGDADRAHVELAELQQGRTLLVQKCGGSCHVAPLPSAHTPAEWPARLDEMAQRSNITPVQRHLIEQYLVTMADAKH